MTLMTIEASRDEALATHLRYLPQRYVSCLPGKARDPETYSERKSERKIKSK
jgi:hypothetical protein